jgi:hypothetical protein
MNYLTHLPQLQLIARTYSKQLGYDEAMSITNSAYIESTFTFNKEKSLFSTWLNIQANGRCKSAITKNKNFNNTNFPDISERHYSCQHKATAFYQMLDRLSNDAKIIINLILSPPKEMTELIKEVGRKKTTLQFIKWYLAEEKEWDFQRIVLSFKEIKNKLQEE